ncbi:N-formylkynurenine (aryl-) formamidase [Galbibacter marinus]|uniref:N-formylkynurenine (Aryl-) formamidase n=1 Tax=Galbibacter marinus TaxID=555500 RepID=K2Q1Y9_9FLAO|nr:cyclase family protein [Galbibacter marinus]EKF54841.1 N-formylkynurenine (aryl-) formamidase [Galbibacter marinus]
MITKVEIQGQKFTMDLSKPIDISIPLSGSSKNPSAWYLSPPEISPVIMDNFVGSVKDGASTNFNTIVFNPHAHGTHTECIGHITKDFHGIGDALKEFHFICELITLEPISYQGDLVITKGQLSKALLGKKPTAVILRTLPNEKGKLSRQYSHTNPAYLLEDAALFLRQIGVKHLLIDLPSVDKEKDGGALLAHKAFWGFHGDQRLDATITEFIFVPNHIKDNTYFLNLQIVSFVNDASPSKPVLYELI